MVSKEPQGEERLMTVAQILIDRADMDPGAFSEKYPDYPFGDMFEVLRWLTKIARDEAAAKSGDSE